MTHPRKINNFFFDRSSVFIKNGNFELMLPNGSLLPIADEINVFNQGVLNTATIKLPVNIVKDDKDALFRYALDVKRTEKLNKTPIEEFALQIIDMIKYVDGGLSADIVQSVAQRLLPFEKECIEYAYNAHNLSSFTDAVDYYNKTYGGKQDN